MNINLDSKIQYLKGVGPKMAEKLGKLGIETISDLVFYWPRDYRDYTDIREIGGIRDFGGENVVIRGRIVGVNNKVTARQRMKITEAVVEDGTGSIKLVWFNQPFLKDVLRPGSEWIFRGKINYDFLNKTLVLESPERVKAPCIVPVYSSAAGLSSSYIAKLTSHITYHVSCIRDFMPEKIIEKYHLLKLYDAIIKVHTPKDFNEVDEARRRLAFEELFMISLRARLSKVELKREKAPVIAIDKNKIDKFIKQLPFELTDDQRKASRQILEDMKNAGDSPLWGTVPGRAMGTVPFGGQSPNARPMNRLLNGDVGSGKTVVAAVAAYAAVKAGYRVVLMVPTEVLAGQHYQTFCELFKNEDVSVGLRTSSIKKISKKQETRNKQIQNGENSKWQNKPEQADIVIGTQALLQEKVKLENIGLVIVDEQHRFGVAQRAKIKNNNLAIQQFNNGLSSHFLSMTATPIPRTLHLTLFGDLDISIISEKPKDRKTIKTRFVEPQNRQKAYDFIRLQIKAGRQVFVICPLIEEQGDAPLGGSVPGTLGTVPETLFDEDRKSVMKEYEKLSREIFPEYRVAMLHGKMKSKEKETILSDFSANKSDILVSTSVLEVGIDIPNASVMMIEDAERFGLAQIHQFRGRVGRAEHQSFCFLFSNSQSEKALSRLKSLEAVSDGFKLAEIDLETRGPGDIFGVLQSGQLELKMASFSDRILIEEAASAAEEILEQSRDLAKFPDLKEKLNRLEASRHLE